jgi:hypothetical protein
MHGLFFSASSSEVSLF